MRSRKRRFTGHQFCPPPYQTTRLHCKHCGQINWQFTFADSLRLPRHARANAWRVWRETKARPGGRCHRHQCGQNAARRWAASSTPHSRRSTANDAVGSGCQPDRPPVTAPWLASDGAIGGHAGASSARLCHRHAKPRSAKSNPTCSTQWAHTAFMMLAMGVLGGTPIQSWNTPSLTRTSPDSLEPL